MTLGDLTPEVRSAIGVFWMSAGALYVLFNVLREKRDLYIIDFISLVMGPMLWTKLVVLHCMAFILRIQKKTLTVDQATAVVALSYLIGFTPWMIAGLLFSLA